MGRHLFMLLLVSDDFCSYIQSERSPRVVDVLSVEKQLSLTLYFLKDQGALSMTANTFSVAINAVSPVIRRA